MEHKREDLTKKECIAQKACLEKLSIIQKHETKKQVIVALVGLVGSDRSLVAKELAKHIKAVIIANDDIRIELRKQNESYGHVRMIAENMVMEVLKKGGNVIFDSDFVDEKKRVSIRKKAKNMNVRLVFVRVHCDIDIMIGRAITAKYHNSADDFFGGASSKWQGSGQSIGAVVKVREMLRRTPHHYHWLNQSGGKWVLKKSRFSIFSEIDTSTNLWKKEVKKCAEKLLKQ